jgi:adenosylmethionine---8-amino-7-oxononanoate aminotransferase
LEEFLKFMLKQSLTERDRKVIWHPYTQHKNMIAPVPIIKGEGSLLFDENGNSYIDAVSSWWVNTHGHAHPYIAEKIYEQATKLEHVIFTGFTHEPAVLLAERLLKILPGGFSKIFYSDNGSTAVEVAIKMVVQYWGNKNQGTRDKEQGTRSKEQETITYSPFTIDHSPKKILAFKNAYHGDTFGAMSVSERSVFTKPFTDYLFEVIFIDTPTAENINNIKLIIQQYAHEIACFIYEPLLQGAGGMLMYEAVLLDELLTVAKENNILCIADEVLTGFGRTGKLFAGEYLKNKADIICLSKGLTGGTMALGVTAATQNIFDAFISDDKTKTFFHGHSFTANPVACAAALASLDLFEKNECKKNIERIAARHKNFIVQLQTSNLKYQIKNVRQIGTIVAFEINTGKDEYLNNISSLITKLAMQNGIYLRPLGNTVYIMPPYCITDIELKRVHDFLLNLEFN